jgi:hypothetical protein
MCYAEGLNLFFNLFMHKRYIIFVNMLAFDKTKFEHGQTVPSS